MEPLPTSVGKRKSKKMPASESKKPIDVNDRSIKVNPISEQDTIIMKQENAEKAKLQKALENKETRKLTKPLKAIRTEIMDINKTSEENSNKKRETDTLSKLYKIISKASGEYKVSKSKLNSILNSDLSFQNKAQQILDTLEAHDLKRVSDREAIFNELYKEYKRRSGEEIMQAIKKANLIQYSGEELAKKRAELDEKITEIDKKYDLKQLFRYLKLGKKFNGSFELENIDEDED